MDKNKLIGNIFSSKSSNIYFIKENKNFYFTNGDKILILNEKKEDFYYFIAFHFKKGFITFPFVKSKFLIYFKKVEI